MKYLVETEQFQWQFYLEFLKNRESRTGKNLTSVVFSQVRPVSIYISIWTHMRQSLNLGPHSLGENKCQNDVILKNSENMFHHYK